MGFIRQNLIFAAAIAGGVATSQLPEFTQQYRQRIGGAIDELGRVVAEFDRDAAANGLTRHQALDMHDQNPQPLFQARGRSMEHSIERLETLQAQDFDFETSSPLVQPFILARSDPTTLDGAWRDFRPAVPMTATGLIWAAIGMFSTALAAFVLARMMRWGWRSAARRVVPARRSAKPV